MWYDLSGFYKSKEWRDLLEVLKIQRLDTNGDLICEHCGKPMIKAYDIIGHHKEELTLGNVNDFNISLNPDNIALVHFKCHNSIHNRFGKWTRHIYLVYGCPFSGKSTWVNSNAGQHDIIVDIDRIYQCISNNELNNKSGRIADNVFAIRNLLIDNIKRKYGKWVNAFIVGGYPYKGERERLMNDIGAEPIYIPCDKETALSRLASCEDSRANGEWETYIEQWFTRYQE